MRLPSHARWVLAAGLLLVGAANLATNPAFVSRANAQSPPEEGWPTSCDPATAPCCQNNDPCCVNGSWSCSCG
jgi:hypothetical protein